MSTYWDVACRTCDEKLGLHGNHQEGPACTIAADAAKLADVGRLLPQLTIDASDAYDFYGEVGNIFPVAWFVKHAGHDIVARNEYGHFATDCNADVTCPTCNRRATCRRPRHTDGEHDVRSTAPPAEPLPDVEASVAFFLETPTKAAKVELVGGRLRWQELEGFDFDDPTLDARVVRALRAVADAIEATKR